MCIQKTINCKGKLLDLSEPKVMGILNLTPDSFYDGGQHWTSSDLFLKQVETMYKEGASIIDIGGLSSKPGAKLISIEEELRRVIQPIEKIHAAFPELILSIDTFRSKVAKEAVAAGVDVVNDISAGNLDDELLPTVAELNVPYILMHMQGTPNTMQNQPSYKEITLEIVDFIIDKLGRLRGLGIKDVIIDVGFGFGKTLDHNYKLLAELDHFQIIGLPILVGLSRKSMIYKALEVDPSKALNGTTVAHTLALQKGAQILRVHDVKAAMEAITIWSHYQTARTSIIKNK